jgi:hypothetical protein
MGSLDKNIISQSVIKIVLSSLSRMERSNVLWKLHCFYVVLNFHLISVFYCFYVFLQPFGCFFSY